jgi:hypothetical protein
LIVIPLLFRPRPSTDSLRNLPVFTRLQRMDWPGFLLFTGSFTCLFLALQWGGQTKLWKSSDVIGLLVGFCLLLVAFSFSQYFAQDRALLPFWILKQRTVLFGTIYLTLFGLHIAVVRFLDRFRSPRFIEHKFAVSLLCSDLFSSSSWDICNQ